MSKGMHLIADQVSPGNPQEVREGQERKKTKGKREGRRKGGIGMKREL